MVNAEENNKSGSPLPFFFKPQQQSETIKEKNWQQVESGIRNYYQQQRINRQRLLMAAALIPILIVGIWFYSNSNKSAIKTIAYTTAYGEKKRLVLPDSSVVILNANSVLKITEQWNKEADRQVWLDGEAYFEVTKQAATKQKFIVYTKDVDIQVLGTRFNVNTRAEKSVIALEEGKIQLAFKNKTLQQLKLENKPTVKEIIPGEVAFVEAQQPVVINNHKTVTNYSGWVRNEFHFNNTPLSDIASMILNNYGYSILFENEALKEKAITGDLRAANLQELLTILDITLNVKTTIKDQTIIISSK
jgi:ferric-dicitrate binding protein FerR (iron transport regulator)